MKTLAYALCFAGVAALALAQDNPKKAGSSQPPAEFKVPERTPQQRYGRLLYLDVTGIAVGIAIAKAQGSSVDACAKFCGDTFAAGWSRQAGFAGFARGALGNFDIFRSEQDPPIEIIVQTDSTLQFKTNTGYRRAFRDGLRYGVSVAEYARWLEIVYQRIADHLGCSYTQRVEGEFLLVTLAKK